MADIIWYPVTGDGSSVATEYLWHTGQINWTTSFWSQGATLVFANPENVPIGVPGSGTDGSSDPGQDNVGLVAGDVTSIAFNAYVPDPSKGDPYIGDNVYSIDLLINAGTVDINNLLMSGFNQYALFDTPQLPTVDVEGATFKVEGSIVNSQTVIFPTITNVPFIGTAGGVLLASGGGTIDIGGGGTVQLAGSVQAQIILNFNDASNDLLTLGAVAGDGPAAFAGTIDGFGNGDTIFLPGLNDTSSYTPNFSNGTLTVADGASTLAALAMSGAYTTSSFALESVTGGTDIVTCFAAGTRIRAARGEVAVEDLVVGDRVRARFAGDDVPIVWIGRRRVDCRKHPRPERVWPVRVAANAFADNVPARDLYVSPDHAVFVEGMLIPVKYLINGDTIVQARRDTVTYYHVELAEHDVIFAEGLAVETYLDTDQRATFENGPPGITLHPDLPVRRWETTGCAPLVLTGPRLDEARRRLHDQAERRARSGGYQSAGCQPDRLQPVAA